MSSLTQAAAWMHPTGSVLSILLGVVGIWCFWRVHLLLKVFPHLEERTAALTTSVSLLTDTTEACFKALSGQLQLVQTQHTDGRSPWTGREPRSGAARGSRQRRVVSAVLGGEAVAAVAAREQVAESEIALRIQLDPERRTPRKGRGVPQSP